MLRAKALLFASMCGLVTALGCNDLTGPSSKLAAARAKWEAHGYTNYAFNLRRSCFCVYTDPLDVIVTNGRIHSVRISATGAALDTVYAQSIESLFDFIDYGIAHHHAQLDVTYDPQLGFPTLIVSDGSTMVADDEVTITVANVVPVSITLDAAKP